MILITPKAKNAPRFWRRDAPPGTLPTLWGDDARFEDSYLYENPATASPETADTSTRTRICTRWAAAKA